MIDGKKAPDLSLISISEEAFLDIFEDGVPPGATRIRVAFWDNETRTVVVGFSAETLVDYRELN